MSEMIDLTGQKFGRWRVVSRAENNKHGKAKWNCVCECGNKKMVSGAVLRRGTSTSCGCYKTQNSRELHKKYNKYDLSGEYGIGYTLKGEEFYFDPEDYDLIKDYCWSKNNEGYINGRDASTKTTIHIHKIITNTKSEFVDHKNRNKLDNRKCNLRIVTRQQNSINKSIQKNNTSGTTGVIFDKSRSKWLSVLVFNGKNIHLGRYSNKEDAIKARLDAELKYFGEYSPNINRTNKHREGGELK